MYKISSKNFSERWDTLPENLKDGVNSALNISIVEKIGTDRHLSDEKIYKLLDLTRGVFLGLINSEDFYKEIKDNLAIDPRLALEIYHEIDGKVFNQYKKTIEDNFISYKIKATKESEVIQPTFVAPRVVLKKEDPEIINLKTESENFSQPKKLKIETDLSTEKIEGPAPVSLSGISITPTETLNITPATLKVSTQPTSQPTVPEGPFMLHKREESQTVFQTQAAKVSGNSSFGGFLGSTMKSFGVQKPQNIASTAKIEMPFDQKASNDQETQKVPVVVKKYEQEEAKTIHYSPYKSPLEKGADGSIRTVTPPILQQSLQQPKKSETKNEGMIDLTNLTLNK
jgi:hypothetical protein